MGFAQQLVIPQTTLSQSYARPAAIPLNHVFVSSANPSNK